MKKNFPNADEARKRTSESWKLVTLEEIQEKIERECQLGNREAWFIGSKISREDRRYLKQFRYEVSEYQFDRKPSFKVAW